MKLKGTNYEVSEDAKVFLGSKEIIPYKNEDYLYVDLTINKRKTPLRLDYVVANTYFPLVDEDGEVIHLDYNLDNCHITNLQWISFESNTAIDILDDNCIIFCVDNNTSNLITFYRGERHTSIKTNMKLEILNSYLDNPISPTDNKYFFRLKDINIIDVNTAYMVFEIKSKMYVIRYEQSMMYKLIKLVKNG